MGFLDNLPADQFTSQEEDLRTCLLTALRESNGPANLTRLAANPDVQRLKSDLLPSGVTLCQWIQHRIGGEVDLLPGQLVQLRDSKEESEDGESSDLEESFFRSLPAGELAPAECKLRQALNNLAQHIAKTLAVTRAILTGSLFTAAVEF